VVGAPRIAEIKCPSLGAFRRIERDGLGPDYILQLNWYLGLYDTQGSDGEWIVFCADQWALRHLPIEFDAALYGRQIEAARQFWHDHVLTGVPPVAGKDEVDKLEIARVGATRTTITRDDDAMLDAINALYEARALKSDGESLEETARERVLALIENTPGYYEGPGFRLAYTVQGGRVTFDRKALEAAKPLDPKKVREALGGLLPAYFGAEAAEDAEDRMTRLLTATALDLTRFEKQGKDFPVFRPTFYAER
jgi:hypothetical protein